MGERTARSLSHWIFSPPLYIYIIKSFLFFLFLYILFYVRNDIIHRAGQQRITGVNQSEVLVRLWQRVIPVHRFGSCVSIPIILWMEGVNSSSRNSTTHLQYLVAKGIGFGALHVLAGPDHLSALATLSAGSSYKAFSVGIRWGLGHSSGLVLIAALFIYLKGELDLKSIGRWGDFFVGIFMLAIGVYSAISAVRTHQSHRLRRQKVHSHYDTDDECALLAVCDNKSAFPTSSFDAAFPSSSSSSSQAGVACGRFCAAISQFELKDPTSQRILAFIIGIVHGIAGPGAILGVLPAVEMQSYKSSFIYLSSFIVTSTLCMGVFAALYGEVSKRLSATAETAELIVGLFSALLSVCVGALWITLSATGSMHLFFADE